MLEPEPAMSQAPQSCAAGQDAGSVTAIILDHPSRRREAPSDAQKAKPAAAEPRSDAHLAAEYIAQLSSELAHLAGANKLATLAYFLDMAACEARTVASGRR